jgi:hypothetical protein
MNAISTQLFRRCCFVGVLVTVGFACSLLAVSPAAAAANIAISTPTANSTVGRTFDLRGTVSEGGGSLTIQLDGKAYIPSNVRTSTDPIPEGPYFAETNVGEKNVAFQTTLDLGGLAVVVNGQRQTLATGTHTLTVCQLLGPQSGCSAPLTINLSNVGTKEEPVTSTPQSTQTAEAESTVAGAVLTPTTGFLGGAFLGAILVLLAHRLRPKK